MVGNRCKSIAVCSRLENFNFDELKQDLEAQNLTGGMKHVLMKRYSGCKHDAKEEFLDNGGYADIERARAYHPVDMSYENWQRTIDHFLDLKYIARCEANAKGLKHLATYRKTHTDKDGNWVDAVAEQNFVKHEIMGGEGGGSQPPNEVVAFQNVLGDRRGWLRSIGHKPSSNMPSNVFGVQPQTSQPYSEEDVSSLFQTPAFLNQLDSCLTSKGKQVADDDDDIFEKDDEDDEDY
ncbi:hypothetical protein Hanom_Chr02g00151191 [Helianthus anomalus]